MNTGTKLGWIGPDWIEFSGKVWPFLINALDHDLLAIDLASEAESEREREQGGGRSEPHYHIITLFSPSQPCDCFRYDR